MKFSFWLLTLSFSFSVMAQNPEEMIIKGIKLQAAEEKFAKVLKTLDTTKKISKDQSSLLVMIHNNLLEETIKLEEQVSKIQEDCSQCVHIKNDFEELSRKILEDEFNRVLKDITPKILPAQLGDIKNDHILLKEKESDLLKSRQTLVEACDLKLGTKKNPTTTKVKPKDSTAPVKSNSSQTKKN